MTRALIRANSHLPMLARGETAEAEVTDRLLRRAASGQISIERTWEPDEGEDLLSVRVEAGTIADALALVDEGEVSAAEALDAEQKGKNRSGLVDALTKRVEDEQEREQAAAEDTAEGSGSPDEAEAAEGN